MYIYLRYGCALKLTRATLLDELKPGAEVKITEVTEHMEALFTPDYPDASATLCLPLHVLTDNTEAW